MLLVSIFNTHFPAFDKGGYLFIFFFKDIFLSGPDNELILDFSPPNPKSWLLTYFLPIFSFFPKSRLQRGKKILVN